VSTVPHGRLPPYQMAPGPIRLDRQEADATAASNTIRFSRRCTALVAARTALLDKHFGRHRVRLSTIDSATEMPPEGREGCRRRGPAGALVFQAGRATCASKPAASRNLGQRVTSRQISLTDASGETATPPAPIFSSASSPCRATRIGQALCVLTMMSFVRRPDRTMPSSR